MNLSVVICNFNHGRFLEERISSILGQLPPDSEIVLLDDASTDESIEIATLIAQRDSRFRFLINKQNLGIERNINYAPLVAKGTYCLPLAVDDTLLPGAIEKLLTPLMENPHMGLCAPIFASLDTTTLKEWIQPLPDFVKEKPYTIFSPKQMVSMIKKYSLACGCSIMVKKDLWFKFGGFQKKLGVDWFFNNALALCEGLIFVPEVLQYWRKTPSSYGSRILTQEEKKERLFSILEHISLYPSLRKQFLRSQILYPQCREFMIDLLAHPKYYDFLFQVFLKKIPIFKKIY